MNSSVIRFSTFALTACLCLISSSVICQEALVNISKPVTIKSSFEGLPVVEPSMAIHPENPDHILIAAMIITDIERPYQSARLSSFVSKDGGIQWKETTHNYWGYDPWVSILPNDHTTMSWLGTQGSFRHQFPVQFFSSEDGGIGWEAKPQTIEAAHGHDGTKLVNDGKAFYFTTVQFNNNMTADVVLFEKEAMKAFTEVGRILGAGSRLNFCEPVINARGEVLVPASHYLKDIWLQVYDPTTKQLSEEKIPVTDHPGGGLGYMRIASDTNSNSSYNDYVYFVRALVEDQIFKGIWINRSIDGGNTWESDRRVDEFTDDKQRKSLLASVAVSSNGLVGISWIDRSMDDREELNNVYFSFSKDGGISFSEPIQITGEGSDPKSDQNADVANKFTGGGHYMDIKARKPDSFQLVWSDSRNGYFQLQTCEVEVN